MKTRLETSIPSLMSPNVTPLSISHWVQIPFIVETPSAFYSDSLAPYHLTPKLTVVQGANHVRECTSDSHCQTIVNHAIQHGMHPHNDEDHLVEVNSDDIQNGILKFVIIPEGFCIVKNVNGWKRRYDKKLHLRENGTMALIRWVMILDFGLLSTTCDVVARLS